LPLRIIHATDNKRPPFVRPTERYRSSLSIGSKLRSTGSLFSNLLELRGRYLVGVQVLLVLVIPIEFDFAGHRPILYRNVYTFRIRSRFTVRRCARPNTSLHPAGLVAIMPSGEPEEPGSILPAPWWLHGCPAPRARAWRTCSSATTSPPGSSPSPGQRLSARARPIRYSPMGTVCRTGLLTCPLPTDPG